MKDTSASNPLFLLERAMGISQHHDSVAGTAKESVNRDYAKIMETGRAGGYSSIAASFAAATGYTGAPFALCPLANATLCPALEAGSPAVITVYNALAQESATGVRVPAGFPAGVASYAVYDATGAPIIAQIVPLSQRDKDLRTLYKGGAANVAWLCFSSGTLPAVGFSSFFIVPSATVAGAPRTFPSVITLGGGAGDAIVTNGRVSLTISSASG